MSAPIISVRGVGKEYRLGELNSANTLRDALSGWFDRGAKGKSRAKNSGSDRIWALKDVSFDVAEGEVLGIIGANGAGKSTLLKILSRITEPTTGEIELRGRVASLLEVGTGFNDELTGRENIILNGAILGMAKREIDRKFDEIVDFSGVERFIDTPTKHYSSGMKMRLAFAVAAHLEPEILIIDEVLAVGDAEFQRKCLGKMDEVAKAGRTVLFVSHNLAAVESLCSRGIVLEGGSAVLDGKSVDAIEHYRRRLSVDLAASRHGEWLDECRFVNPEDGSNSVLMGRRFDVRLTLRTPRHTTRPKVGIVLRNANTGEPVFDINTDIVGCQPLLSASNRFRCCFSFEDVALTRGAYSADIWLGADGETYQVSAGAAVLHVLETDIYGTGRLPQTQFGSIFVRPRVQLLPAPAPAREGMSGVA